MISYGAAPVEHHLESRPHALQSRPSLPVRLPVQAASRAETCPQPGRRQLLGVREGVAGIRVRPQRDMHPARGVNEPPVVVLFTGSQKWRDSRPIRAELDRVKAEHPGRVLVPRHGACPRGGDAIAERVGKELGYRIERHPARWQAPCDPQFCWPNHLKRDRLGRLYCPSAGFRRNQKMVDTVPRPDIGVAMIKDKSPGTTDCVRRMRTAGIPVRGRGLPAAPVPQLPLGEL